MPLFYHIYISPRQGVTLDQIRKTMDLAVDWCRYDDKNWIVYTTSDAKKWYSRLQKHVRPGGEVFICKFDISDYWGSASKILWDWLEKRKKIQAGGADIPFYVGDR